MTSSTNTKNPVPENSNDPIPGKWKNGEFCWAENFALDPDAAKKFYTAVLGWGYEEVTLGNGQSYSMWKVGEEETGGLSKLEEIQVKNKIPPHWLNFIYTDDIIKTTEKVVTLDGKLLQPPFDVPGAGKMAIVMSPSGEVFGLWQQKVNEKFEPPRYAHGKLAWRELLSKSIDQSKSFYSELFAWKVKEHDMAGVTYYEMLLDNEPVCRLTTMPDEAGAAPSYWASYFNVDDIASATEKVKGLGGKIYVGPKEIPGIGTFSMVSDPQGAVFSVITFKR